MQSLSIQNVAQVNGGSLLPVLDPNQSRCWDAKVGAVELYYGPGHYDVLDVANSLRSSCPFEYPDLNMAIQAAIEPFTMAPPMP